jgi:hypothetical protein
MAACAAFVESEVSAIYATDRTMATQFVLGRESARAEIANENQGLTPLAEQPLGTRGWGNKQLQHCVFKAM